MSETPQTGMNMADVFQIIAKMSEENQKNTLLAIQEMKKPSAEEQVRLDEERARLKQRHESAAKLAMAEEEGKRNRMNSCPHGTYHPGTGAFTHQWRAQVHTPHGEKPYFRPTCTQCGTQLEKILATPEQMQNGVNLDQYKGIDVARLQAWANSQQQLVAV